MQGRILIDNQPHELFSECPSASSYEERALLLATEMDIVILRKHLPIEYLDFISNSRKVNIVYLIEENGEQELAIAALSQQNLRTLIKAIYERKEIDYVIQSYIPNRGIDLLAQEIGLSVYGKSFYLENHTKRATEVLCKRLGFSVIPSVYLESQRVEMLEKYENFLNLHQVVIAKPEIGLGGKTKILNTSNREIPDDFLPAIVQAYLKPEWEGSVQFYNYKNRWHYYLCDTMQMECKFYGFRYPSIHEESNKVMLIAAAEKILENISGCYADIPSFGIDFLVHRNKVFFHDLNPRHTAVTYIISLLRNLYGINEISNLQFIYAQLQVKHKYTYYEIRGIIDRLGLIHLSSRNKEGYAILYPGMIDDQYVNILIVSNTNRVDEYYKKVEKCILNL